VRGSLRNHLTPAGYDVLEAGLASEAMDCIHTTEFDVILVDLALPDRDGLAVLERAKAFSPEAQVIAITDRSTFERGVDAMKAGAFDYLTKPFNLDEVTIRVERAIELRRVRRELHTRRLTSSESSRTRRR